MLEQVNKRTPEQDSEILKNLDIFLKKKEEECLGKKSLFGLSKEKIPGFLRFTRMNYTSMLLSKMIALLAFRECQ